MSLTEDLGEPKVRKGNQNPEEAVSLMTGEDLIRCRKKYYFPNDVVAKLPASTDRVYLPPPGFVGIHEASLKSGLRFPPAPELLDILKAVGICISQLSSRAVAVITGLIVLFRERGVKLTPEILARLGSFSSGAHGRVFFNGTDLIMESKDTMRHWSVGFFFVKNDWGLLEKIGDPLPLPRSLEISMEEILVKLKFSDFRDLQLEIRYVRKLLSEERLRKAGIFTDIQRSIATRVKGTERRPSPIPAASSKRRVRDNDCEIVAPQHSKRKTSEAIPPAVPLATSKEIVAARVPQRSDDDRRVTSQRDRQSAGRDRTSPRHHRRSMEEERVPPRSDRKNAEKDPPSSRLLKIPIPEHVLGHSCLGHTQYEEWVSRRLELDSECSLRMKDWNTEFVKTKYLLSKLQSLHDSKCQEVEELNTELSGCRTELSTMVTTLSVTRQALERAQDGAVDIEARLRESTRALQMSSQRTSELEEEIRQLKSGQHSALEEVKANAIDAFKASYEFREIVRVAEEEARAHIYRGEIRDLKRGHFQDGYIRGFFKGIRVVHRETGASIDGLTLSQASGGLSPPPSDEEDDAESSAQEHHSDVEILL